MRDKLSEMYPEKRDYFNSSFMNFEQQLENAEDDIIKMEKERGAYGKTFVASVPGCAISYRMQE